MQLAEACCLSSKGSLPAGPPIILHHTLLAPFAILLQPPCDFGMSSNSRQGAPGLPGRAPGPPPPRRMTIPFAQQVPKPPPQLPALKEASHPIYNLQWEKLKAILEKRFPDYEFSRRVVSGSQEVHVYFRALVTDLIPPPRRLTIVITSVYPRISHK